VFSGLRGDDVVVYAVENQTKIVVRIGPLARTLVEQYRAEKMPKPYSTRRSYEVWINNHILPQWGACEITDVQARPVEMWLQSLNLAPRSLTGIRGMLRTLWEFAMWRGDLPVRRNPMELVTIKCASKRMRQPRSLTVDEFQKLVVHLEEPFHTMALVCVCFGLRISEALGLKWVTLIG
jgi:integrase